MNDYQQILKKKKLFLNRLCKNVYKYRERKEFTFLSLNLHQYYCRMKTDEVILLFIF